MKKVFSVLTVAVLAVSTVFAGFSGSVSTSAGYDLDNKAYGFFGSELANAELKFTLGEESVDKQSEGDVYASVKAAMDVYGVIDKNVANAEEATPGFEYNLAITEAKIGGKLADKDWYVSLLGMNGPKDLAGNFADAKANAKVPYNATNGVEAGFAGYAAGFGIYGTVDEGTSMAGYVNTPAISLGVEGLTLEASAAYSHDAVGSAAVARNPKKDKWVFENGAWTWKEHEAVAASGADQHNMGGSVKVAYANEDLKLAASVASDLYVKGLKAEKPEFGMDLAANVKYDFISADLYYGYKDTVNVKVAADLKSIEVPVNFSLGFIDLANDSRSMTAAVGFEGYGAKVDFTSQFGLKKDAAWKLGLDASYTIENIAKIAASVGYDSTERLTMSISAENNTLIPDTTLALGWYGASDLLQKHNDVEPEDAKKHDTKFVPVKNDFGAIKASVTVKF